MKIAICVKIVQGEINPFDAAALETALRMDGASLTVVSMGPEKTLPQLTALTRFGDFRTILITDKVYAGSDTLATSRILAEALRQLEPEMVFCGRQSIDGETAQVGPCLATMLGFSFVGNVLEYSSSSCRTRFGTTNAESPTLLAFERIRSLRFPSLRSRTKNVEIWTNDRLRLDPLRVGLAGSPTRVLETFEAEHGRRNCQFIKRCELEPLLDTLRKDPIRCQAKPDFASTLRLPEIWAVGQDVAEIASTIADHVVVLNQEPASTIAKKVMTSCPSAILWNADAWGRETAPQVAAMLETGLCADCTKLDVVEKNGKNTLEMHRPALGGNVIARIHCRTKPVMATVRTSHGSDGLIVSCGRGVADRFEDIRRFAEQRNAELAVSRALVDRGVAPYEIQVGLTGRHISPDIYLAIGISGTVQHLCAVENAGTIIAVNPDKNARIFDYADYGIIDRFY